MYIEDAGALTAASYGAVSGLTNGISFKVLDDQDEELDLLDGVTLKNNAAIAALSADVNHFAPGAGTNYVVARFTYFEAGRGLRLESGDTFRVVIADDLTGLVKHRFFLLGHYTN
jgi:hypothetical protein